MKKQPDHFYRQSGVIPIIRDEKGGVRILLIKTRKGKRWIIPKGVVEEGMTPRESATKEAFEEAGIIGETLEVSMGRYRYDKWKGKCTVEVFVMVVGRELKEWMESFRQRRWFSLKEAGHHIQEAALKKMIKSLPEFLEENLDKL